MSQDNNNQATIVSTVTAGDITQQAIMAELNRLRAENEALKRPKTKTTRLTEGFSVAVGAKGGICIYGFGKFPVTLYHSQLLKLVPLIPMVLSWANQPEIKAQLKNKEVK